MPTDPAGLGGQREAAAWSGPDDPPAPSSSSHETRRAGRWRDIAAPRQISRDPFLVVGGGRYILDRARWAAILAQAPKLAVRSGWRNLNGISNGLVETLRPKLDEESDK
ncbi:hypothetical protein AXG93_1276s1120 [Marchantia polymorpha subsp. ruderalis]|uniref:Uncharacterized protein n=1 Tax=Marchantia polymorpha subsp. ruderalis TaxID=1480154 RepID=A0A176WF36_MARPO|nr:hypothetical protein AXG93_1276s1120 [Marchantia polymorpha subsp. ruderalis]